MKPADFLFFYSADVGIKVKATSFVRQCLESGQRLHCENRNVRESNRVIMYCHEALFQRERTWRHMRNQIILTQKSQLHKKLSLMYKPENNKHRLFGCTRVPKQNITKIEISVFFGYSPSSSCCFHINKIGRTKGSFEHSLGHSFLVLLSASIEVSWQYETRLGKAYFGQQHFTELSTNFKIAVIVLLA